MKDADATLPLAGGPAVVERFAIGSVIAGRYRIERFIAAGGMGEVYAVHDLVLDTRVALKTLKPELEGSTEAIARLRREITLAREVTNVHVCRLYDVGEHDGRVFITMELLDGVTLAQRVGEGPLAIADVERIAVQLVAGLAALHRAAIVHRDFKTSNVMLVGDDSTPRAVITDFGLARSTTPENARITTSADATLLGTPSYMAPEQVEARPATQASDVYALGVVLFELLTGTLPFVDDNPMATATARLKRDPPAPSSMRADIPTRWDAIVLRCLARDPAARFTAVEEVLDYRPRSRRWLLAAGGGTLAAAALGLFRYRGCVENEPTAARDPNELVAMFPVEGEGGWRTDPWRTAITVDLYDALTTACVPLISLVEPGMSPGYRGLPPQWREARDPVGAALAHENVSAAITLAFSRTQTEAELVVTLAGRDESKHRLTRKIDEVALLVEDAAALVARRLGYRAPRQALDSRSIDAAMYERYGAATSWYIRPRTEEDWQAIDAGKQDPPPRRLKMLATEIPTLVRAGVLYAGILQADGEQHVTLAETMDFYDRADAVLDRVLGGDSQNPLAHAVRGHLAMLRYDWKRADAETALAMELAPTHGRVAFHRIMFLSLSGRFEEAIALAEQNHARSPDLELGKAVLSWDYYTARRYPDVIRVAEPVLSKLDPEDGLHGEWVRNLALTYAEMGRYDDALALARRWRQSSKRAHPFLVRVYMLAGRTEDAKAVRAELGTDVELIAQVAMADAFGEIDLAVDLLERIVASHNVMALFIKVNRYSTQLRSDPRFQKLLATVSFP